MNPYYDDGTCVIYHGDCRDVLPALDVGLILTDPPYGIEVVSPSGKTGGAVAAPNRVYRPIVGDSEALDPRWLCSFGRRQIVWGADHFVAVPTAGRLLVWDKRDGMTSNSLADCEVAWDSAGGPSRLIRHRQVGMIHDGLGDIGRVHPTQKPLRLMAWCLEFDHAASDLVVDPYMGSGTTLRAAKDRGRPAIGIELDEAYCEVAAKRLAQEVLDFGASA